MPETAITLTLHGVTTGGVLLLLGIALKQHKVWVRMKDRMNSLWRSYCKEHDEHYVPLENGHSGD